jgi:hypothetical protein
MPRRKSFYFEMAIRPFAPFIKFIMALLHGKTMVCYESQDFVYIGIKKTVPKSTVFFKQHVPKKRYSHGVIVY